MQAVKWVVAKLQGDETAYFCKEMSGREVTERYIGIPVFHGTLLPMDFWTPPRFLNYRSVGTIVTGSHNQTNSWGIFPGNVLVKKLAN